MDDLGAYGSESSSSADGKIIASKEKPYLIGLLGSRPSGRDDDDEARCPSNPPKRLQLQNVGRNETLERMIASPPIITTRGQSIAHLDEDHLSALLKSIIDNETSIASWSCLNSTSALEMRSANDLIPGQTLAQIARSKSDFYNPRFFQIVWERFRIDKPLESRAKHDSRDQRQYEKQLFRTDV